VRLNPRDLPDFSAETLANTIPAESTTVTLLSQLVKGLVTISHELSGVSQKRATISQENDAIREELHDVSSQLANLISKKSVCSGRIGIASGPRKSVWSILSAQPALRWPQHNGCILVHWAQYNPHPVRPVHLDGPFHALIS